MRKKDIEKMETVAYTGYGIEVKHIEHDTNDYIYYTSKKMNNEYKYIKRCHKKKIYYTERPYFIHDGIRVFCDEIIRTGAI